MQPGRGIVDCSYHSNEWLAEKEIDYFCISFIIARWNYLYVVLLNVKLDLKSGQNFRGGILQKWNFMIMIDDVFYFINIFT